MAPLPLVVSTVLTASLLAVAPPKLRLSPNRPRVTFTPQGKPVPKCPEYGNACHVNSKHADPVGTFTKQQVQKAKHSSLLLTSTSDSNYKCSAVMISPAWALTAKHCLDTVSATELVAVLHDEYTAATADSTSPVRDSNRRQFEVLVLEKGTSDWALLNLISHLPPDTKHYAKLAQRKPNKDEKTLAIHHPLGQAAQASSGAVREIDKSNPVHGGGASCATDWLKVAPGSSGAGVFAMDGTAIGLVGGNNPSDVGRAFFIQMNTIVAESTLLKAHVLGQGLLP